MRARESFPNQQVTLWVERESGRTSRNRQSTCFKFGIPLPPFPCHPHRMPIHCPLSIRSLSADEFEQRDYRVMGHSYACQNELGRLCDECVYEADLKARLLGEGFREVQTQVPVTVNHGSFSKTYHLDLIADDALYELKTKTALTGEDDAQLIHYILLLGIQRGKLLNFRTPIVQGRTPTT